MNFAKSILLGYEGAYQIGEGITVQFKKDESTFPSLYSRDANIVLRALGFAAQTCIQNYAFQVLTLGYVHVFVHEMGHALANRILGGGECAITIRTTTCTGETGIGHHFSPITHSIVDLTGPLMSVIFSSSQIFGAIAFIHHLSIPVAVGISAGASVWIIGELFYATVSSLNRDPGDFGQIASRGIVHYSICATLLIGASALGLSQTYTFVMPFFRMI